MTDLTPFELDVLGQPAALRTAADAGLEPGLLELASRDWERILFTGMGSSHFAGLPTWRSLTAAGRPTWSVDTGQLLDTPGLITADTLVFATSQSGASGEIVELVDRFGDGRIAGGQLVGITADPESPLATAAELYLPLLSGDEATVSTKSYLNTLAAHRRIVGAFRGEDPTRARAEIAAAADRVTELLDVTMVAGVAKRALGHLDSRLASVGRRDDAATALFAGLITKEAAKVPIEGHVGGQFRHGPFELAGPGLTVFLYGAYEDDADPSVRRLAEDLVAVDSSVVLIGDLRVDGATTLTHSHASPLEGLVGGAVIAELIAIELAKANGVTPGAFAFGSKVTTAL
ncbi:SIS domain-containing protein [Galbitalea soli]|uniref:Glutamine--fructose-6-phosphate aminotransferase [isomerizing] n=1 Tax=Galbitalea soli TaxID=1268042 RepID=A0A7C9PME7_9MICO|nr:SIS domain-containing protein [Galbitalea soli]NEM90872.1 SIS domain-containing protein [Galbitalea soli]NYJ31592.1 glucosamine--fructose-6-phosphate aminotransferase (isomerizing) [Galbitalea soli]